MLHLMPAWAHRVALRFGHQMRKAYLRIFRPHIAGVCILIRDEQGRVLLLRQSYGPRAWTLPAGGAGLREDPEQAIRREMREELGCELVNLRLLKQIDEKVHGAPQRVSIFTGFAASMPSPDRREVVAAQFFALNDLPSPLTRAAMRRLSLLDQARP